MDWPLGPDADCKVRAIVKDWMTLKTMVRYRVYCVILRRPSSPSFCKRSRYGNTTVIMPYITSSIILQLMTVVFPYLERLQKEGELGRRKITQYTRYLTIVLSVIQSSTIATALQSQSLGGQSLVYRPGYSFVLMTILTLTTGSAFIMWLGEQISERGIGNGMSLIIFTGIVVGLPRAVQDLSDIP